MAIFNSYVKLPEGMLMVYTTQKNGDLGDGLLLFYPHYNGIICGYTWGLGVVVGLVWISGIVMDM